MNIGPNNIGYSRVLGYTILASMPSYQPWAEGVTIDWANVTAEVASRTLKSGYITTIGEKVIDAGSVLYRHATGKYRVALAATALVKGETCVCIRDLSDGFDLDHVGDVTSNAEVISGRLLVGGAAATLANLRAATDLTVRNF